MAAREPPLSIGIEEEYLLVDRDTGAVASEPPPELFTELNTQTAGRAFPEFLRSQVEVATPVCRSVTEARHELTQLRRAVIEVAARFGLAPIAASTHPFSLASSQKRTDKERYVALLEEMQGAARRMMICGLHVHVGIDDDELRIDLMNQLTYFLPHMLALSCSSPFWEGERTGLMSFRMLVFNAVPRTGLPEPFPSWSEYRRHTDTLIETGVIGYGLLAALAGLVLLHGLRVVRRRNDPMACAIGFAGAMAVVTAALNGLTDFSLRIPAVSATLACLAALALGCSAESSKSSTDATRQLE